MSQELDYINPHYCPVYKQIIDTELCYESLMCRNRTFTVSSVVELTRLTNIEEARQICAACPYSEL